jgi:hypothetical protein
VSFETRTVVQDISLYFTKIRRLICVFIKFRISSETAQSYLDSEKVKVSSGPWVPAAKSILGQFFSILKHVNLI